MKKNISPKMNSKKNEFNPSLNNTKKNAPKTKAVPGSG
jgi:hypothetical protein